MKKTKSQKGRREPIPQTDPSNGSAMAVFICGSHAAPMRRELKDATREGQALRSKYGMG